MYGAEPRYNDLRFYDIPGLTMGISLTGHKILPVLTINPIAPTTRNANIILFCKSLISEIDILNKDYYYYYNYTTKQIFITLTIIIISVSVFKEYSGCCNCNSFDD